MAFAIINKLNSIKGIKMQTQKHTTLSFSYQLMETIFEVILYVLMIFISSLIYLMIQYEADAIAPSLLIGFSALTASVAMTRSVYATKVSDEKKEKRELVSERLNIYIELRRIIDTTIKKRIKREDGEILNRLSAKSRILFNDLDIFEFIESLIAQRFSLTEEELLDKDYILKELFFPYLPTVK